MNAQNIPSKAHDIRHMFRATPEITEHIQVQADDEHKIRVKLSIYDSIPTESGQTKVKDLNKGDVVMLKATSALLVPAQVESIEFDLGYADITLVPKGE